MTGKRTRPDGGNIAETPCRICGAYERLRFVRDHARLVGVEWVEQRCAKCGRTRAQWTRNKQENRT